MSISQIAIDKIKKYSDEYIRANYEIIPWDLVCQYNKIDERTLRQFNNKINWDIISQYQRLSEDFIRDYISMLNTDLVCRYQYVTEKFINELNLRFNNGEIMPSFGYRVAYVIIDKKDNYLKHIKLYCGDFNYDINTCIKEVLEYPKLSEEIKTKIKIDLMCDAVKI